MTSMRKRAKKHLNDDEDSLLSQLPDDILITILSLLTLKEAGRTSVLSHRWIDLWKNMSCLIFESSTTLDMIQQRGDLRYMKTVSPVMKTERLNFVKGVNMVLRNNTAPVIKEFIVCFNFGKEHERTVEKWLTYVFSHHVERLELNFSGVKGQYDRQCTFPRQLLNRLQPSFNFKPLKLLSLKAVDVTDEDLGFFLDNCPFLEKMVVWHSRTLVNVDISGFSLKLKHLEMCYCLLESLKELVALNLNTTRHQEETELLEFPELTKLKKLVLGVSQYKVEDEMLSERFEFERLARVVAPLIRAAPFLQEFVLEFHWRPSYFSPGTPPQELKRVELLPLQFLKVLKISGFTGQECEFEFIKYLMESAVALKSIIIDPHNELSGEQGIKVRDLAKQFEREVPAHIQLLILNHTTRDSETELYDF